MVRGGSGPANHPVGAGLSLVHSAMGRLVTRSVARLVVLNKHGSRFEPLRPPRIGG